MGRRYAGILGSLAFATVVIRGALTGSSAAAVFPWAAGCLAAFAALGFVLGSIAESTITTALKMQFEAELARLAEAGEPAADKRST